MQNLPFVSLKAICHTNHFIWLFHAKSRFKCILCLKTKAAGSIWFKDKLDAEPIQKLLERFALSYFMHSRPNIFINMQRSSSKFCQMAQASIKCHGPTRGIFLCRSQRSPSFFGVVQEISFYLAFKMFNTSPYFIRNCLLRSNQQMYKESDSYP